MNEIKPQTRVAEASGRDGDGRPGSLAGGSARGGRLGAFAVVAVAGALVGVAAAYFGVVPVPGRAGGPDVGAAVAGQLARAEAVPELERADGHVTIPEGSPYRARVVVAPVTERSLSQTRAEPAAVEAEPSRVFNILPPLGGRVTQLNVRLGDHVTAGQPLAVIDSGDLAQAYSDAEKARAQLALTKRALERARGLSQVGGGAVKDVESASNDEAQAEAEFNRADARLKAIAGSATLTGTRTLTISAPAAGVVTALSTAQGAYINDPTQTMLTITNLERVWVTANVPEADVGFVAKGQAADVSFVAYPGQVFHGTVMFVSAVMEPDTRRTKVRIGFDNPDDRLKPNMFATVTFKAPAREVLSVPDSALLMNNDSTTVFVETAPWTFVRRAIEPGYAADGHTVVDAGLKPGERIVISGGVLLND
jgi:cobalt-zinc-cadmium efflux system membrane fusion protein